MQTFIECSLSTTRSCGLKTKMTEAAASQIVRVAVGQMLMNCRSTKNYAERIIRKIIAANERGAQLLVLPECASTGYNSNVLNSTSPAELVETESRIADACKQSSLVSYSMRACFMN